MTLNVAVAQPLPGIGDMIWHLPHIRAIAAHAGGPVTLIAKPRSAADQIFSAESTVRDVFWLDRNPEGRRGAHGDIAGFMRLVRELRARRFDAVYILHHSKTLAFLTMLAGIPARYGYGYGVQRWFLNRPPVLPDEVFPLHPFDQATRFLAAASIPMGEAEPILPVTDAARASAAAIVPAGAVAIGIGSSESYKQWGAIRFAALADALARAGWCDVVLIGGAAEAGLAAEIRAACAAAAPREAIGRNLAEIAALCQAASFYVGNDTGVMNIAAATGVRTYGLFGAVPPFHHSSRIVVVSPPGGIAKADGMARISVEQVMAAIAADHDGVVVRP